MIELLTVIAIMGILGVLMVPAVTSLMTSTDLTSAAYSIKGALEEARTYAVANNTYTWAGFFEEDSLQVPVIPAKSGIGRVVISLVASVDGTSIYNKVLAEGSNPTVQPMASSRLVQIGKLIKLNNVHILDATNVPLKSRPVGVISDSGLVGLSSSLPLLFSFQYPLSSSPPAYTFGIRPVPTANGSPTPSGIVQFDPRGEVTSECGPTTGPAPGYEIAVEATHGTHIASSPNLIALDISGLTGQVTMYRP